MEDCSYCCDTRGMCVDPHLDNNNGFSLTLQSDYKYYMVIISLNICWHIYFILRHVLYMVSVLQSVISVFLHLTSLSISLSFVQYKFFLHIDRFHIHILLSTHSMYVLLYILLTILLSSSRTEAP